MSLENGGQYRLAHLGTMGNLWLDHRIMRHCLEKFFW